MKEQNAKRGDEGDLWRPVKNCGKLIFHENKRKSVLLLSVVVLKVKAEYVG